MKKSEVFGEFPFRSEILRQRKVLFEESAAVDFILFAEEIEPGMANIV